MDVAYAAMWVALLIFLPIYLPAGILLAIWFGSQFLTAFNPNSGVAWLAHVGGFIFGGLVGLVWRAIRGGPPQRYVPSPHTY